MTNAHHSDIPVSLPCSPLPQAGERNKLSLYELPVKLYGIPNCNTVKKARDYLAQHEIAVDFHDFKKRSLDEATLQHWLQQRDWTELVNRRGLTWRGLSDEQKATDTASASKLMLEKNSVIKRPLLEIDGKLCHVGFDEAAYVELFK